MKTKNLLTLMALAMVLILPACTKDKLQPDKQSAKQNNLKGAGDIAYSPEASLPTGYYLIKNRWTGEFLNFAHKIQYQSGSDQYYYLERGNGPLTDTYVWYVTQSNRGLITTDITSAYDNSYCINLTYNLSSFSYGFVTNTSLNRNYEFLNRWSDVPAFTNSTDPTGPYAIWSGCGDGHSGVYVLLNCETKPTKQGYAILNVTESGMAEPGWDSKNWYFIPVNDKSASRIILDNYLSNTNANFGGTRYIYQCQGSTAISTDPNQLQYKPSDMGWWDMDGNGYCAKFSYSNVVNGIAGFGINLSNSRDPVNLYNWKHGYGITFWACSDYGRDDGTGPLAQVQLPCSNITTCGWLGNYYHYEFPLTYNWHKYEISFYVKMTAPIYDSNTGLTACVQQALGIEFQQGIDDNRVGNNLQGNIYIDDVELY